MASNNKIRLDQLLVQNKILASRTLAKQAIEAGEVFDQEDKVHIKPGEKFFESEVFVFKGESMPYVSRGGLKLEQALDDFQIPVMDKTAMDIGASTGGFTDVLLQNNIRQVFAVDVGTNQLVDSIKNDPRVVDISQVNFRELSSGQIDSKKIDLVVIDVSFISLRLIWENLRNFVNDQTIIVALIKPQFEAGKNNLGKNGVIKDGKVHLQVLKEVIDSADNAGFYLMDLINSPIKGGSGNREFIGEFSPIKNAKIKQKVDLQLIVDDV
jgi:23S rRNA (cytidine1920-2'-O)/16S rRNA (cytidine1409-2'-O)-methyltransferase